MTELKKIELTEEALDQVSGGKIQFGKNTFKKIAIVGAAIMLLAIGGGGGYVLYKHKKDKKSTSENNQGTELQDLSKKDISTLTNPVDDPNSAESYRYNNDFDPNNP